MTSTPAPSGPVVVEVEPTTTAVVRSVVPTTGLADFFDRAFGQLGAALAEQGVAPTGAAFALYHRAPDDTADLEVGFPTAGAIEPRGDVEPSRLPGGRVARAVHAGSFDGLGDAWGRLLDWVRAEGLEPGPTEAFWEVYLTEPSPDMDPADLRTELNRPVAG